MRVLSFALGFAPLRAHFKSDILKFLELLAEIGSFKATLGRTRRIAGNTVPRGSMTTGEQEEIEEDREEDRQITCTD